MMVAQSKSPHSRQPHSSPSLFKASNGLEQGESGSSGCKTSTRKRPSDTSVARSTSWHEGSKKISDYVKKPLSRTRSNQDPPVDISHDSFSFEAAIWSGSAEPSSKESKKRSNSCDETLLSFKDLSAVIPAQEIAPDAPMLGVTKVETSKVRLDDSFCSRGKTDSPTKIKHSTTSRSSSTDRRGRRRRSRSRGGRKNECEVEEEPGEEAHSKEDDPTKRRAPSSSGGGRRLTSSASDLGTADLSSGENSTQGRYYSSRGGRSTTPVKCRSVSTDGRSFSSKVPKRRSSSFDEDLLLSIISADIPPNAPMLGAPKVDTSCSPGTTITKKKHSSKSRSRSTESRGSKRRSSSRGGRKPLCDIEQKPDELGSKQDSTTTSHTRSSITRGGRRRASASDLGTVDPSSGDNSNGQGQRSGSRGNRSTTTPTKGRPSITERSSSELVRKRRSSSFDDDLLSSKDLDALLVALMGAETSNASLDDSFSPGATDSTTKKKHRTKSNSAPKKTRVSRGRSSSRGGREHPSEITEKPGEELRSKEYSPAKPRARSGTNKGGRRHRSASDSSTADPSSGGKSDDQGKHCSSRRGRSTTVVTGRPGITDKRSSSSELRTRRSGSFDEDLHLSKDLSRSKVDSPTKGGRRCDSARDLGTVDPSSGESSTCQVKIRAFSKDPGKRQASEENTTQNPVSETKVRARCVSLSVDARERFRSDFPGVKDLPTDDELNERYINAQITASQNAPSQSAPTETDASEPKHREDEEALKGTTEEPKKNYSDKLMATTKGKAALLTTSVKAVRTPQTPPDKTLNSSKTDLKIAEVAQAMPKLGAPNIRASGLKELVKSLSMKFASKNSAIDSDDGSVKFASSTMVSKARHKSHMLSETSSTLDAFKTEPKEAEEAHAMTKLGVSRRGPGVKTLVKSVSMKFSLKNSTIKKSATNSDGLVNKSSSSKSKSKKKCQKEDKKEVRNAVKRGKKDDARPIDDGPGDDDSLVPSIRTPKGATPRRSSVGALFKSLSNLRIEWDVNWDARSGRAKESISSQAKEIAVVEDVWVEPSVDSKGKKDKHDSSRTRSGSRPRSGREKDGETASKKGTTKQQDMFGDSTTTGADSSIRANSKASKKSKGAVRRSSISSSRNAAINSTDDISRSQSASPIKLKFMSRNSIANDMPGNNSDSCENAATTLASPRSRQSSTSKTSGSAPQRRISVA